MTDRGLTLIELVVAVALFGLVAVMGLGLLTGMTRQQAVIAQTGGRAAELDRMLGLLRADIHAAVPVVFTAQGAAPQSALASTGDAIGMTVAGQPLLPGASDGALRRAEWRLDQSGGVLSRTLRTTSGEGTEVRLLTGVTALSLRSFIDTQGWYPGPGHEPGGISSDLPSGIEITVQTAEGPITVIEALR